MYYCVKRQLIYLIICSLTGLCFLAGCAQPDYKKDADEQVYRIIDQKWQDGYGSKTNYKVSDTEPSAGDIQIAKEVPVSGLITLPQAIALATAHNREYQTQREELYIRALDLKLTRHQFEQQYFGGFSGGYSADRDNEVIGFEANYGFNRLLAQGTQISTKIALAWAEVLTGDLRSGVSSILSATITQPLLRGSDRDIVLENLTQAERDILYQVRSFNRYRQTFIVSVISQYYMVLLKWDAMQNAQNNSNTLAWICDQVEKLANAGRVPLLELERISQDRLQAMDDYIRAEKEYQQALDEFKITLSLPTTTDLQLDTNELANLKKSQLTEPDFSQAEAINTALLRRLDLVNSADAVVDAQRKVTVAADSLRAELNLVGSANARTARRADRQTLDWSREDYSLGLELDLPLDRVPEQHVYRKALLTLNKSQRDYEQYLDIVKLQIRNAYRDLSEAAQRYSLQTEGLKLAEKRYNDTMLLLRYGRASSRRVLDAQDDLVNAQNVSTQALVDYAIATLNFYSDSGVLQVRPDGMWQL
jgi:outer membrane protein TolC